MTLVAQLVRFIYQSEASICPEELAEVQAVEGDDLEPSPRLPLEATRHPPGSAGKIAIMAERASRGEQLFHPEDRKGSGTEQAKLDNSVRLPKVRRAVLPRDHVPTEEGGLEDDWTC